MGIDLNNYEQFFLDHLEGNLSDREEQDLFIFLQAHPDLKILLEELDVSPIPSDEPLVFLPKDNLKKIIEPTAHINEGTAEEWMVAATEGLLGKQETTELQQFLELNPAYRREMKLFGQTRLVADPGIVFPNKNVLRKKLPVLMFPRIAWSLAAAAAVILLIFLIRSFMPGDEIPARMTREHTASAPEPKSDTPAELNHKPKATPRSSDLAETPKETAGSIPEKDQERAIAFRMEMNTDYLNIKNRNKPKVAKPEPRIHLAQTSAEPDKPGLVGRLAENLVAQAGETIRENTRLDEIRKPRLNIWNLFATGIKGFNTISDRDIELYVRKDEDGKVSSYALVEEDRLILSRDLNKN